MASRGKELLTGDQRTEFVRIPSDITDRELEIYYTFSQFDLENIKRHRRDHNRLGFAVQLCVLRYPGWSLSDVEPIPDFVIKYIAKQIDASISMVKRTSRSVIAGRLSKSNKAFRIYS